jgi:hypothetical protein
LPAKSEKQRKFMGAELDRLRAGKETKTSMSEDQLSDFASKGLIKSINAYLTKRSRVLPCGHYEHEHEIEGLEKIIAGGVAPSETLQTTSQCDQPTPVTRTPATGQPGSSLVINSADPISLINRYLDKQSRLKCGHKKGDPNHLEAA